MEKKLKRIITVFLSALLLTSALTSCSSNTDGEFELLDFNDYEPILMEEYIVMEKNPDEDFVILNLSDTQLMDFEWAEGDPNRLILEYTIDELIKKVQPDLITISGDIAWANEIISYRMLADLIESYGIPWAPVWGNHDHEAGIDATKRAENILMTYENCLYEKGDEALGMGNYIISIEENGTPITGVFMVDSHNKDYVILGPGNAYEDDSKLTYEQLVWYSDNAEYMKHVGYKDSVIIQHIPIYAYKTAFDTAFKFEVDPTTLSWEDSYEDKYWNEGYEDSYGVRYEAGGIPDTEDGVLDVIEKVGHTKYIIAGHDHINNFVINYRGVNLVYTLNTGMGCYWNQSLNGGTVIKINSEGIYDLHHEYINVDHLVQD